MPTLTVTILVVTAALVCLPAVTAQSCNPGQFTATDGTCTDCSPGTFSTNGAAAACSECPAGSFNNVGGAVGCCSCCSGFYQASTGQTSCTSCGGPNSPVGSSDSSGCGQGTQAAVGSCSQDGGSRTCPATFADSPTNNVRRRRSVGWSEEDGCSKGQRRCNGKCTDISSNLWHCGACAGTMTAKGTLGQDCAEIPHASDVRCEHKRCVVESCIRGRVPSTHKRRCVKPASILKGFRQQFTDF